MRTDCCIFFSFSISMMAVVLGWTEVEDYRAARQHFKGVMGVVVSRTGSMGVVRGTYKSLFPQKFENLTVVVKPLTREMAHWLCGRQDFTLSEESTPRCPASMGTDYGAGSRDDGINDLIPRICYLNHWILYNISSTC